MSNTLVTLWAVGWKRIILNGLSSVMAIARLVKYVKGARNLNQQLLDRSCLLCMLDLSGEAEISSAEEQLIEE